MAPHRSELKILVVDDSRIFLSMMTGVLKLLGVGHIETAETPEVAIELAYSSGDRPYDIVFVDSSLGAESGLEVLRAIRERDVGITVFFLAANQAPLEIVEAFNLGADDCLPKPLSVEKIVEKLAEAESREPRASRPPRPPGRVRVTEE